MHIRKARTSDAPAIRELAESLGLDFPGMDKAPFWVAEEKHRIRGIVSLLAHSDCLELVGLGVDPDARSAGLGGRLIESVMAAASGDVFLATIIPGYFRRHGFSPAASVPSDMAKDPAWCEGCPKTGCAVMVRTKK